MRKTSRKIIAVIVAVLALLGAASLTWKVKAIQGTVQDQAGQPLPGAVVRVKATNASSLTDASGGFTLTGFAPVFRVRVTAWRDGYYIGGASAWPWDQRVEIALSPYRVLDNANYSWLPPAVEADSRLGEKLTQAGLILAVHAPSDRISSPILENLNIGCRNCHSRTINDQWASSAHSLGALNLRFITMYNGTNVKGEPSPPTRHAVHRDYGRIPLPPDPEQPYYGPGFKLDFPDSEGNCATCHLPTSALENPYGSDPNEASDVDARGTHCDFCHKISTVKLDPATGQPFENMPGILSIELMRPKPEKQLFFGPYDDVDVGPDTYLPLMKQSEVCAPCHAASFWGVPIYQSFTEWLDSPYPGENRTCQSCHMRPNGVVTNFAPGRGGVKRSPDTIPTHDFPGAGDETLLQNTAEMAVKAWREGGRIFVEVNVTNAQAGHHIPTDSPLRQIFLTVNATDEEGHVMSLQAGPTLPKWAGDLAGKPGVYFAKILEQTWTGVTPTGAYWTQTGIVEDTRLPAKEIDTSQYTFEAPEGGGASVEVQLIFRRAYYGLMQQKGWNTPDILMEKASLLVPQKVDGPV